MNIDYFPVLEFEKRIIEVEGKGGEPKKILINIPSLTRPGIPFKVKISVLDRKGLPSFFNGNLKIKDISREKIWEIKFEKKNPAILWIPDVCFEKEGIYKFYVEFNKKTFFSNPSYCNEKNKKLLYWGDPHVHSLLSNCNSHFSRSIYFSFISGKYVSNLDWVSITDHVSNGRSEPGKWKTQKYVYEIFNEDNSFITLPGYEASLKSGNGGDNNVYLLDFPYYFADEYENGNVKTLTEKLKSLIKEKDFFVVPHHTSRKNKHGYIPDEIYPGEKIMPLIEVYSKWGSSEYKRNPDSLKNPYDGNSYVVDFLNRGFLLGFICGTDTHGSIPSGYSEEPENLPYPPGLTGVYSSKLTRKNLFKNLKDRNCYGTKLERILIDFSINGVKMGKLSKINPDKRRKISIFVLSETNIKNIEIIRNGKVIFRTRVNDWKFKFNFIDEENLKDIFLNSSFLKNFVYYYLRVHCSSGGKGWTSPIWFIKK